MFVARAFGGIMKVMSEKGKNIKDFFHFDRQAIAVGALDDIEKIYQNLVESLPVCIKVLDEEGHIIFINTYGKWEHFLEKKSEQEIREWDVLKCALEEDVPAVKKAIQGALDGETSSFEVRHTPGRSRHDVCYAVFSPFRVNGSKYVFILSLDVSKRREAEKRLEEKSRRLEETERIAHLGGFEWDIVLNKAVVSKELFRILKKGDSYFDEQPFDKFIEVVHPDDREQVKEKFKIGFENKKPFEYDCRVVSQDGTIRALHSNIEIITNEKGEAVKMVGILQDVTEHRESERELEEKMEELERLNKHMVGRELKMAELKKENERLNEEVARK